MKTDTQPPAHQPSHGQRAPRATLSAGAQFKLLCGRLREAAGEVTFRSWRGGASGTVIMKSVFTLPRFYLGCEGYLHLWLHCALKTMNESVVEGMGGVWDRSSPDARHCSFEASAKEAVVAWTAPWPYHPSALPFINHALNHLFGTKDWASHFMHINQRVDQANPWTMSGGKVVGRTQREGKGKLLASMYDTPAPIYKVKDSLTQGYSVTRCVELLMC